MQEHNWVVDFLKHKIEKIQNNGVDQQQYIQQQHKHQQQLRAEEVGKEINEFVINLRNHFVEEEQIVFPLALKAAAAEDLS
jgi:iron-sulfur cluster repair protein YtfE (RIC family)